MSIAFPIFILEAPEARWAISLVMNVHDTDLSHVPHECDPITPASFCHLLL